MKRGNFLARIVACSMALTISQPARGSVSIPYSSRSVPRSSIHCFESEALEPRGLFEAPHWTRTITADVCSFAAELWANTEASSPRRKPGQIPHRLLKLFSQHVRYLTAYGPPGAGKDTLLDDLVEQLNAHLPADKQYVILGPGKIFRAIKEVRAKVKSGESIEGEDQAYLELGAMMSDADLRKVDAGILLGDEVTLAVVRKVLTWDKYRRAYGIILNGIPRTPAQWAALLSNGIEHVHETPSGRVEKRHVTIDLSILMNVTVSEEDLFKYRIEPRGRPDDTPASFANRMTAYWRDTDPLLRIALASPGAVPVDALSAEDTREADRLTQEGFAHGLSPEAVRNRVRQAGIIATRERFFKAAETYLEAIPRSASPKVTRARVDLVSTTGMPPTEEVELLRAFRRELRKEKRNPGSGKIPRVAVISDQHGDMQKFDTFILDAIRQVLPGRLPENFELDPEKPLPDQLAVFGIQLPDDLKGKLYFHNLGDMMDRGEFGIKVYRRSRELIQMGLSDFVVGNHCFWMMKNLMGFHLPWYRHFNFHGYRDTYDTDYGRVPKVVEQFHVSHPETQTKTWWAAKLSEFTHDQRDRQKTRWKDLDERVNGPAGLFAIAAPSLIKGSKDDQLWEQFHGFNGGHKTSVSTGIHAVGEMSVVWWEKLLHEFEESYAAYSNRPGFHPDQPAAHAWRDAIHMMARDILPELRRDLQEHLEMGDWWWRVFEAINSQNYSSPEWWAKDWIFHLGWGTSVLRERNEERPANKVTDADYFEDPVLAEIGVFIRENFYLRERDIYQIDGLHAFLPVGDKGEFTFTYKGPNQPEPRIYSGSGSNGLNSYREGLDRLSSDVRNTQNTLNQLYEAFRLVNRWYADNTTIAKEAHVANAINTHGPDHLSIVNSLSLLLTGHLPFHEFHRKIGDRLGFIQGFLVRGRFGFTDHGMEKHFGGRGAYVLYGPEGIRLRGYRSKESRDLEWDPPTAEGTGASERILFRHPGMSREQFVPRLISDVNRRIEELEGSSPAGHSAFQNVRYSVAAITLLTPKIAFAALVSSLLMGLVWRIRRSLYYYTHAVSFVEADHGGSKSLEAA